MADAEYVQLAERKDANEVFHEIGNFFRTGDIHDDGKHNMDSLPLSVSAIDT